MENSFDFENMVRYSFVHDGIVDLPDIVKFHPKDTLIFLKNGDNSMIIVTKDEFTDKIKELQENIDSSKDGVAYQNLYKDRLKSLYDSIITTAKIGIKEWNIKTESGSLTTNLGIVRYFLSEEAANGKEPVVFRHDGKYLVMYYGALEYKNGSRRK